MRNHPYAARLLAAVSVTVAAYTHAWVRLFDRHLFCFGLPHGAPRMANQNVVQMRTFILWRDVVVGLTATIGLALWVRHDLHDYRFTIFTVVFVLVIFVPRT
jgi:hypothetical protein